MRTHPKKPPTLSELKSLRHLGMQEITYNGLNRKERDLDMEKEIWQPPPKGYLKCNIDGASKSNPGIAGYGGVLRDEEGNIIFTFHLGRATNNRAELMALEQC